MKFKLLLSLTLLILLPQKSAAFFKWFFKPKYKREVIEYKASSFNADAEELRFVFISDANLYPVPTGKEKFGPPPHSSVGIMYEESQVLLQEAIRDILKLAEDKSIDFVLFGGNQVADNSHWELFQDMAYELKKLGLDYYYMLGYGETQGPLELVRVTKEPYYYLKTKGAYFIILDNARSAVVPDNLPEEATEQYMWLEKLLKTLDASGEEAYIFSYMPLDPKTRSFINSFHGLNLKMLAHSYELHFNVFKEGGLLEVDPDKDPLNLDSNSNIVNRSTIELTNSAISVYPNTFTIIERNKNSDIKLIREPISLEGVRSLAKEALELIKPELYD